MSSVTGQAEKGEQQGNNRDSSGMLLASDGGRVS